MPEPGSPEATFLTAARAASAHVFVDDLEDPVLGPGDRHHLGRVMRLRPGETVSAADGRGGWRLCAFDAGRLEAVGEIGRVAPAEPSVAVGFALTKGDRPEWAVQKLTEIGVERIIPLITARSVVRWEGERVERHLERLREVVRQAGMQSRRLTLPVVDAPCSPADVVRAVASGVPALAEPGGAPPSLAHPVVLVGPEGGWDPTELATAAATVTLGSHVLRTETAAVVAGTLLVAMRSGLARPIDSLIGR
ncbi:MAG: 16S rRNA (uracil(1498)-N(3))-methyltransferase [Acidimicrobiaceae bacterium]|nr:16S rRNA (uracil(1498)-N(3))-methyltransferase [Acidimicrobiaceae bacterium]